MGTPILKRSYWKRSDSVYMVKPKHNSDVCGLKLARNFIFRFNTT